jgi:hypothetical protein
VLKQQQQQQTGQQKHLVAMCAVEWRLQWCHLQRPAAVSNCVVAVAALVAGWKVGFVTAGAAVDPGEVLPMSGDTPPPEAEPCPVGFYYTGDDQGVWGCKRCPHGAITRQNGSISLDDCRKRPLLSSARPAAC